MISKDNRPITDLDDWGLRAGPKSESHWKPGRSAMEAARAWLAAKPPGLPPEVAVAMASHADFGPVLEWNGEPEVRLSLDGRPGEPRNTDLLVESRDAFGPVLIAVEAKADEPFDRLMADVLSAALESKIKNSDSGALARAQDLAVSLLSARAKGQAKVGALRYQLFTAAVGVLRAAEYRGIERAVLLVHEFITDATTDKEHASNASDLDDWLLRASSGQFAHLGANTMVGPIVVGPSDLLKGTARLFVAKAVRNIRTAGR